MVDKDRSGTVNAKELADLFKGAGIEVTQFQIRVLLYLAGVDESGEVTFSQFATLDAKLNDHDFDPEEMLRVVFRAADKDGSGSLSKDEIRRTMINECHMMTEEEFQALCDKIRWSEGDINWQGFLATFKDYINM